MGGVVDWVSDISDSVGSWFGTASGHSQTGKARQYREYDPLMVDSSRVEQSIQKMADYQRDENVGAFNAAIQSQRGVSPTIAAMQMGNNLARANQVAGQQSVTMGGAANMQAQLANQQAHANAYQMNSNNYNAAAGLQQGYAEGAANRSQATMGGLIQGGASAVAAMFMSDERVKEKKKKLNSDDDEINEFLESLSPHTYRYKENGDGADGGKKHLGIMAQNVEKTDVGEGIVSENENGTKQLDVAQLTGSLAAGLGAIHRRLQQLESGGNKNGSK